MILTINRLENPQQVFTVDSGDYANFYDVFEETSVETFDTQNQGQFNFECSETDTEGYLLPVVPSQNRYIYNKKAFIFTICIYLQMLQLLSIIVLHKFSPLQSYFIMGIVY